MEGATGAQASVRAEAQGASSSASAESARGIGENNPAEGPSATATPNGHTNAISESTRNNAGMGTDDASTASSEDLQQQHAVDWNDENSEMELKAMAERVYRSRSMKVDHIDHV